MRRLKAEISAILAASGLATAFLIITLVYIILGKETDLWLDVSLILVSIVLLSISSSSWYSLELLSHEKIIQRLKAEKEQNEELIQIMEETAKVYAELIETRTNARILEKVEKESKKIVDQLRDGVDEYTISKEVRKKLKATSKERGQKLAEEMIEDIRRKWDNNEDVF